MKADERKRIDALLKSASAADAREREWFNSLIEMDGKKVRSLDVEYPLVGKCTGTATFLDDTCKQVSTAWIRSYFKKMAARDRRARRKAYDAG